MSKRVVGGFLGVPPTWSISNGAGIWTPEQQFDRRRTNIWPGKSDPYFANVSLLLHLNGTNNSTVFPDSSSNAFAASIGGNAKISTAQSKFGGASLFCDGDKDFLQYADNAAFQFGTGDFTIETWYYVSSVTTTRTLVHPRDNTGYNGIGLLLEPSGSGGWQVMRAGYGPIINSGVVGPLNAWTHIAATRASGQVRLFIDGSLVGGPSTYTGSLSMSLAGMQIGTYADFYASWSGYIDEFRITKGVARYTANFTPAGAEFPNF